MDKKMKDFICVAIAFITTIASLQFYIIEGESSHSSVNFINPGDNTYNYLEDEIIDFFRSEDLTEVERRIDTPNDDLRLVRFLLHDGTEEIRLFNEAVKYVDDIGQVHTKSLTLFEIDNYGKYRYSNRKNDIAMRFGNTFTDGIALNYKNYEIEIYPIKANETRAQISPDAKSICYNEAFSAQTRVEYIAEYSGLKETIVLEEYEEINTFSFVIATELSLKLEDGIVRAFDNNNNCVGNFGSVAVTDMAHNETGGFITINRINDARYLFTVTVPMEYLASEETVYPVAIDPTFYFNQYSYNFAGYKQIYDVTLYSTGNCYAPNAEVLTVNGMPYSGYSRVLIKFPNILTILNKIGADNLLGVYYAYNGLTNSTNSVVIKPMGVNWSTSATSLTPSEYSALFNGALSTQQINDTIHYGPGILNITAIAEDWMHSVYPNRGIMIECINTSGYNNIPSNDCLDQMEDAMIFIIRGHGFSGPGNTCIQLDENSITDTLISSAICNNNVPAVDFSNMQLAIFAACKTAYLSSNNNLVDASVAAGSEHAIGFTDDVWPTEVNHWVELFLEARYSMGLSVAYACAYASNQETRLRLLVYYQ